ncbi:MutL protein [Longilinea arvoryzae]|uniref:MutL protein n=1 Tax=Longilinea arvoryzae TaxID=360412 RepID=A0A0S7BBY7_9CHLR|nr:glutamate mutase L [Longilinea arvoryzae]GAP15375.1 MutL protein [Longilinea arvoryzae]
MTTSLIDAESVLVLDLGSLYTRALFFDVVDGQYRFVASSSASTTANAPYHDVREGAHTAILQLQEITGREFTDAEARIVVPTQPTGEGVDRLVIISSVGSELRIVTMGLLDEVSVDSANRLASTTCSQIVESIGLNDRRKPEIQMDAILRASPDLVILAGGTEHGATRSIGKLVELISLVCRVTPTEKRPQILFAGNQVLARKIKEILEKLAPTQIAPNIRPSIDLEDLSPAQQVMGQMVMQIRQNQIGGLQSLASNANLPPVPSPQAFGRMIRFLSHIYDPQKGVLGIDLGSSSTTLAVGQAGKLLLDVLPYGTGYGLRAALQRSKLEEIESWLSVHVPQDELRDYLYQKSLFPQTIPTIGETFAIEQAMARQILRLGSQHLEAQRQGLSHSFEPIVVSGGFFSQAPLPGQAMLAALDGIQPVGIGLVLLDTHGLLAALGAVAPLNSILPVQVLESAFQNLGTVISPVSDSRYGTPILKVRLEIEQGDEIRTEVKQGALVSLPLKTGQVARIHLEPLNRTEIDPRRKTGGSFKIIGGLCGVVIDARGRSLALPPDASRRRDMHKKWLAALTN